MELVRVKKKYQPDGVSHSSLGWFEISPKYFKENIDGNIERPEKDYFDLGTKLHMYLLQPEEFAKCYTYLEYDTPRGDKQKQFCSTYLDLKHKAKKTDDEAVVRAYVKTYATDKKSEDKIKTEALELYNGLKKYLIYLEAQETYKEVLNYTTLKFLEEAQKQTIKHKLASQLLHSPLAVSFIALTDIEEHNEFKIRWKHPLISIDCVSTLDRLVIDHDAKIIRIIDLKTTYRLNDFVTSFDKYKYYRQLAFYWMAVEYYFKETYPERNYEDYKKESYIIALQTNNSTNSSGLLTECEVFDIDQSWLDDGKDEVEDLLTRLSWHFENDLWEHKREYYDGTGSIKL